MIDKKVCNSVTDAGLQAWLSFDVHRLLSMVLEFSNVRHTPTSHAAFIGDCSAHANK